MVREMKRPPVRLILVMMIGLTVYVFVAGGLFELFMVDDAFISFQYAKQIARGEGFTFNAGEPVFGSFPLFTLIASLLFAVDGVDCFILVNYLSILCIGLQGLLAFGIFDRLGYGALRWPALLLPLVNWPQGYHYIGQETNFLAVLLLGALYLFLTDRRMLGALLLGLACLTRYDSIVFAVGMLGFDAFSRRRVSWKLLALFALPIVPWLVYAACHFGSILPNTLAAKKGMMGTWEYLRFAVQYLTNMTFWGFRELSPPAFEHADFVRLSLMAVLGLSGAVSLGRRAVHSLALPLHAAGLVAGYAVVGSHVAFTWHLYPAVLFVQLTVLGGIGALAKSVPLEVRSRRIAPAGVSAVLCLALLVLGGRELAEWQRSYPDEYYVGARSREKIGVSRFLVERTPLEASLLVGEVGQVGFFSDRRILDTVGLITPGTDYHRRGDPLWLQELAGRLDPDFIASHSKTVLIDGVRIVHKVQAEGRGTLTVWALPRAGLAPRTSGEAMERVEWLDALEQRLEEHDLGLPTKPVGALLIALLPWLFILSGLRRRSRLRDFSSDVTE